MNGNSSERPTVESSPAASSDGTIYYGVAYDTAYDSGALVALTGSAGSTPREKWYQRLPSPVYGSPLLAPDGYVYVGCWNGKLYAANADTGATKAIYDVNPPDSINAWVIETTPALSRDASTLYVCTSRLAGTYLFDAGAIVAVRTTVEVLWRTAVGGAIEGSPTIAADGTLYAGSEDKYVYALNGADGTIKWTRQLDGAITASAAIGGDGTVYIGSNAQRFVALNPADGSIKWQVKISTPGSAAVGADGTVYVANFFDGDLYALNPDGSEKWRQIGPPAWSTPIVRADDVVIFGGQDQVLRAYDGKDGKILWTSGGRIKGLIESCPVILPTSDHTILVGASDGTMYAFAGNEFGISRYAAWPMLQRDSSHLGQAVEPSGGRLVNLSTRGLVGADKTLTAGYVLTGRAIKQLLVRGVGPALQKFDLTTALPDPKITVRVTGKTTVNVNSFIPAANDNWSESEDAITVGKVTASTGAFPLVWGSKDASLVVGGLELQDLNYTATVESANAQAGIALVEVYDTESSQLDTRLVNISTRGYVGTGDNVLIAGLNIEGPGKQRVLVRAVGPGLTAFGVSGVLAQPTISMYDHDGHKLATNTGWTTNGWKVDLALAAKIGGAFPLSESSSDCALIATLTAGQYTFVVSGVGGTSGEALVEVYALPF
jgi:outer membrane protein assembly factor BamB